MSSNAKWFVTGHQFAVTDGLAVVPGTLADGEALLFRKLALSPLSDAQRSELLSSQRTHHSCSPLATSSTLQDMKAGIGSLSCRMCGASYQMPIHHLHEPVDVFSEWLDDCEAAHNRSRTQQQPGADSALYEDDNDELPESSGFGSRKPAAKKGNPKNDPRAASIDLGLNDSEDDDDED